MYAFRSILDHGARITLGSDFPVEDMNPLAGFYAAITRVSPDGTSPHGPGGWYVPPFRSFVPPPHPRFLPRLASTLSPSIIRLSSPSDLRRFSSWPSHPLSADPGGFQVPRTTNDARRSAQRCVSIPLFVSVAIGSFRHLTTLSEILIPSPCSLVTLRPLPARALLISHLSFSRDDHRSGICFVHRRYPGVDNPWKIR